MHLAQGLGVVMHVGLSIHAIFALGLLVSQRTRCLTDLRSVETEVGSRVLQKVVMLDATILNFVLIW